MKRYKIFLISGSSFVLIMTALYLLYKAMALQSFANFEVTTISGQEIVFVTEDGRGHEEIAAINKDGTGLVRVTYTEEPRQIGRIRRLADRFVYRYVPHLAPDLVVGVYKDAPIWSPQGEKVAFVSGIYFWDYDIVSHKGDIYVMNADGSDLKRLTHGLKLTTEPVWSPDGAYLAIKNNPLSGGDGFYVINVSNGEVKHLLRASTVAITGPLSWSPDGTKILFSAWEETRRELFLVNRDGSNLQRLSDSLNDWEGYESPIWSPDGSKIAFIFSKRDEVDIYVMNSDGTNPTRLTESPERRYEYLQWSPDGTMLVFQADHGWGEGREDIYVVDIEQGNSRRLTTHEFFDGEPKWGPDSQQIVFVSQRDGNFEIYLINKDGSNLTRLTFNPTADRVPDWIK